MALNNSDLITYLKSSKPTDLAVQWGEARYRPVAEQANQFILDPGKLADFAVQNNINSFKDFSYLKSHGLNDQNLNERLTGAKQKNAFSQGVANGKDVSTLPEFTQWLTGAFKGDQKAATQYYGSLTDSEKKALQRKVLGDYGIHNNIADTRNANVINFKPNVVPGSPYDAAKNNNVRSSSAVWDLVTKLKNDYFSGYDITKSDLFKNAHPDIQQQALQKLDEYYRNPIEWNNRTKSEGYNSYNSGDYTPLGQRFKTPQEMDAYFAQQGVVNTSPASPQPQNQNGINTNQPSNPFAGYIPPQADINSGTFQNGVFVPNSQSGNTNTGQNDYQTMANQDNRTIRDPATGKLYIPQISGSTGQSGNDPSFRQDYQDMANQDNRPIRDPSTGRIYQPQGSQQSGTGGNIPASTSNTPSTASVPPTGQPDSQAVNSLVDQALLNDKTTNLNQYGWWNSQPESVRSAAYARLQEITGSPQGLADYAFSNGLTNVQNYSWWSGSQFKDQAWQIIRSRQGQTTPSGGSDSPSGSTGLSDAPSMSGPASSSDAPPPPVSMSDLFPDITTTDPAGSPVIDFDKFLQQIGYKNFSTQLDNLNSKMTDVAKNITARETNLSNELVEIQGNPWINASSLDKRVNIAREKAKSDIALLTQQQQTYADSIKSINDSMKQAQDLYSTYVDQALKIENNKRENAKLQLQFAQAQQDQQFKLMDLNLKQKSAQADAIYKAADLKLKQSAQAQLERNNIQDNARQAIATLVQGLGPEALTAIDPQTFANAGFGSLDMAALAGVIKTKAQQDMLKNTDTPFAAWVQAYNSGDTAKMQAVEAYLQSQKASGTNLGNYLLGGGSISLPSVASDNASLKGKTADGELILANCVKYLRTLIPSLPYGLTTLADKKRILLSGPNASHAPVPGAAAVFDVGTTAGHVAEVVEIQGDRMRIREANYGGQYARDDRWVPVSSAVGFWIPPGLQSKNDSGFPAIDSKFDEYYAQYKAGTRTKDSILSDLTYGVTDKGQVKIIRDYVNNKWTQQEQVFAGLNTDQINKFFQRFGLNVNIPNIPAQSKPKYPLNEKQPGETSRKLTTQQILQLKAAGVWQDKYASMNIWDIPDEVTAELF